MGLIVKPTNEKKIYLKNTEVELNEVYVRIDVQLHSTGKHISFNPTVYQSKNHFKSDVRSKIYTDIDIQPNMKGLNGILVQRDENEPFDVHTGLAKAKTYFEDKGYLVELESDEE